MKYLLTLAMLVTALICAPRAEAILIGGQDIIAAPVSVVDDHPGATNDHQQAFNERQNVTLGAAITVDGGTIAAGTMVDSHMIFLNTCGTTGVTDPGVLWTFDGTILGVMSDVGGLLEAATNSILGASGTTYPGSFDNRGLEGNDGYNVAGNQITVNMHVTEPGDWIRVVTASRDPVIPEPMTLGLVGLGLAGLLARRKKRA